MKMKPARRRDPALKERPAAWGHTLLGDHISAADLDLERIDPKLGTTLLDAGTLFGDLIVVSSKTVNDTIMAFREFYGEEPFYCFHPDNAKEPKAAAEQEPMVHLTSTPHRPEPNGVAERFNQPIVDGARCLLRTSKRAARALLALRVQGLPPGSRRLREGQGWADRVGPTLRQGVPRQAHPVRLESDLPAAEAPCREVRTERPRGDHAWSPPRARWPLQGRLRTWSLNIDNLLIECNPKSNIHKVKEVVGSPGPNTYPLREAKIAKRERATEDVVEDGTLEELEVEEDVEMPTTEEIEDMERPLAIEDGVIVEGGALQRIPRASRIYMPRVGPPPRPPVPDGPLDDSMAI